MKTIIGISAALAMFVITVTPPDARAEEEYKFDKETWPLSLAKRPLILAPGMLEIGGDTMKIELDAGAAGDQVTLAPDIRYALNRTLMIGVTHERGICLAGCDEKGEDRFYDDVGINATYGLMHGGSLDLTVQAGFESPTFDTFTLGLVAGMQAKVFMGKVALVTTPNIYVGLANRDERKEVIDVPLHLQIQISNQAAAVLESGLSGVMDTLGDDVIVPVGASILFAVNNRLDLGAGFRFDDVTVEDARLDQRTAMLRVALRL